MLLPCTTSRQAYTPEEYERMADAFYAPNGAPTASKADALLKRLAAS